MSDAPQKPRLVRCPQCGKPAPWSQENPYRPFCSKRCRLIDLGQWVSGAYRLPIQEESPSEETLLSQSPET